MQDDDDDDAIPTRGEHRGIGLHAGQCERRLAVVRRDIDDAIGLGSDVAALLEFARDPMRAPESRLFAGAKLKVLATDAARARKATPIDLDKLEGILAGLNSREWRSPDWYGTDLDPFSGVQHDPLDAPLE